MQNCYWNRQSLPISISSSFLNQMKMKTARRPARLLPAPWAAASCSPPADGGCEVEGWRRPEQMVEGGEDDGGWMVRWIDGGGWSRLPWGTETLNGRTPLARLPSEAFVEPPEAWDSFGWDRIEELPPGWHLHRLQLLNRFLWKFEFLNFDSDP